MEQKKDINKTRGHPTGKLGCHHDCDWLGRYRFGAHSCFHWWQEVKMALGIVLTEEDVAAGEAYADETGRRLVHASPVFLLFGFLIDQAPPSFSPAISIR